MANRYDVAVSQYVPIPFLELFTLAKYNADETKAAQKELNDYVKSVGEFQSLLTKDVDSYNRIALNDNVRRIMDEAAANPNIMKSAAWRRSMAGALNSVNYSDLSKLKKSAELADLYDKLYKSLAAQGKMPPGWEKDWYSTYDTLKELKIFDKTPLPYSSVEDVAYSYVDKLEDTHLGSSDGYNWYGVDEKTALRQVKERESELLADQYVNRHYEILREAGLTDQEALQEIRNRANTAALRAVRKKPVVDPYAMARKQAELEVNDQPSNINTRIAEHQALSNSNLIARYSKELDDLTAIKKVSNTIKFKDLNKEEQDEVLQDLVKNIKSRGITKDDLTPVNPTEYYNWSGAKVGKEWTNGMAVTDKAGNSLGADKEGELYNYRPGDTMYTLDGKIVPSINVSFMTGKNQDIVLSDILFEIKNNALYNMSGNVHPYNYGEGSNVMQTDGYLYVSEKALDDAIETVLPGKGSQFRKMLNTMYKVVEKVDGLINGDDVYRMRVGRGFGDIATWNASHNRNYIGDAAGSSTVAKNYSNITGSSWVEAGDY